ncbi:hypothetical protein HW115_02505 [Verrucomicrobiaceae bacterium N1E253]|uniref:Uncharacterized protein n=1 Tax=Oceaniferula marina TaxID=2748318 RepID=A0A851GGT6_9BACT|nr:hypothetical protein [Oceaniferula marina]NWK54465.1 hypothetical protein [Oceaniferula marina]
MNISGGANTVFFNGESYGNLADNFAIDFYYAPDSTLTNGILIASINDESINLNFRISGGNYQLEGNGIGSSVTAADGAR